MKDAFSEPPYPDTTLWTVVPISQVRLNEICQALAGDEEFKDWLMALPTNSWFVRDGRVFGFEDPDVALLFKLTWGAR